jgi:HNH endonuclease
MSKPKDVETDLTAVYLRSRLVYEPLSGLFRWRKHCDMAKSCRPGQIAGSVAKNGRRKIRINGHRYRASRLAVLYMTGRWPRHQVDHEDLDPGNDRWGNLREASHTQNGTNRRVQRNNKLGMKGISRIASKSKPFRVRIWLDKKCHDIGRFTTVGEAMGARKDAAHKLHGNFARET